jgi:hypothetical protein
MRVAPIGGCVFILACAGGSSGTDAAAQADATTSTDVSRDGGADAPEPNAKATLLLSGRARLVGERTSACSNQVPATGDRWCAFSVPSRVLGRTELWAINLSKALGGAVPTCDGSDPGCVLVSDDLWTGRPREGGLMHPFTHRFEGDTLVYHARAPATDKAYRGPIFAWRAGWPAGRQISLTGQAYTCSAHPSAEVAVCMENLTTDPGEPIQFDLTAGSLAGTKQVMRITPTRPGTQMSQWRVAFSRAGDWLAWSTGGLTPAEPETIYAARVADVGMPEKVITVARAATRWAISADDKKIFFLRDYDFSMPGSPRGTLVAADFPAGGNEATLATGVAAFAVLTAGGVDRGIGFYINAQSGRADFKILPDVSKPGNVVPVLSGVAGLIDLSPDLAHVMYAAASGTEIRIARTDGSGASCSLASAPPVTFIGPTFSPSSTLVFWSDSTDLHTSAATGFVASVDCSNKRQFANQTDSWFFAGQNALVFSDDATGTFGTLLTAPISDTLGPPTVLQHQVANLYTVADGEALLFTLAPGGDNTYALKRPF